MGFRKPKEGVRDPENRSDKDCVCGGHSANDVKKNLNHHGTRQKALTREARRVHEELLANMEDLPPEYGRIVNEHFWELVE